MCLLSNMREIQAEIMTNGPVIGFITPSLDFLPYENGVYH